MALVSPGLQITVTDESQYVAASVGTVPLVFLATAQESQRRYFFTSTRFHLRGEALQGWL